MKKLFLFVAILIVAFSFNSCGDEFFQDRPVASNELMNPIKDFITNRNIKEELILPERGSIYDSKGNKTNYSKSFKFNVYGN